MRARFLPGCALRFRPGVWIYRGKCDLFLELAAQLLAGRPRSLPGEKFGHAAGLALIVLGTAMVAIAATRFLITAKNIDSEDLRHGAGSGIDVALPALLVLLGSYPKKTIRESVRLQTMMGNASSVTPTMPSILVEQRAKP